MDLTDHKGARKCETDSINEGRSPVPPKKKNVGWRGGANPSSIHGAILQPSQVVIESLKFQMIRLISFITSHVRLY